MKSRIRVQQNGATKAGNTQPKTTPNNCNGEIPEPGIDNGCFSCNSRFILTLFDIERDETFAGCNIKPAQLRKIKSYAKSIGLPVGELLMAAIRSLANQTNVKDEIRRGFILISLSEWEKKEMRDLARESGLNLRMALSHALLHEKAELKGWAHVKRMTGLNPFELFCGPARALN
jgi:hypothetical protein